MEYTLINKGKFQNHFYVTKLMTSTKQTETNLFRVWLLKHIFFRRHTMWSCKG